MKTATISHEKAFKFLTGKQLKELVPSMFTTQAPSYASEEEYILFDIKKMMDDLAEYGWRPYAAKQMRAKLDKNIGYEKHFIRFRNPNFYVGSKDAIEVIPEISIINSHNARCRLKLTHQLFKVACENGLVIASGELKQIFIPHKTVTSSANRFRQRKNIEDVDIDNWKEQLPLIEGNTKQTIDIMNRMRTKHLSPYDQVQFVKASFRAHSADYLASGDVPSVLERLRPEDEGSDLWTIFNVVQEKLIRGGWIGGGNRKMKPLTNPDRELMVNRRLYEVVEQYL